MLPLNAWVNVKHELLAVVLVKEPPCIEQLTLSYILCKHSYFCFLFLVLAADFNITAVVLSSTSIKVNWSIPEQEENVTSIFVFYKTLDSRNFQSQAIPTSLQGGFVIENLMKFTPYKITVAPTTVNGTGIPSSFVTLKSFEDGMLVHDFILFLIYETTILTTLYFFFR